MLDLSAISCTFSDLARDSGLSLSSVSRILRGERRPSLDAARQLTEALSRSEGRPVSLDELYGALDLVRERLPTP